MAAQDSVLLDFINAVIYNLENRIIKGGAGICYYNDGSLQTETMNSKTYNFNLAEVNDVIRSYEQQTKFPAVNVYLRDQDYQNAANTQLGQNQGLAHIQVELVLDCFLNTKDLKTNQELLLADIIRFFGMNHYNPDETGLKTCQAMYPSTARRFGIESDKKKGGVEIIFKTWVRHTLVDPGEIG